MKLNSREMKYTKGKWVVKNGLYTINVYGSNGEGPRNQTDGICSINHLNENYKANAILISKAPEMYEILKGCEEVIRNDYGTEVDLYKKIQSLLNKIEK